MDSHSIVIDPSSLVLVTSIVVSIVSIVSIRKAKQLAEDASRKLIAAAFTIGTMEAAKAAIEVGNTGLCHEILKEGEKVCESMFKEVLQKKKSSQR